MTGFPPELISDGSLKLYARSLAIAMVEAEDYIQPGEPVVYVMGFANGFVKVGQTSDIWTRETAHRSNKRVRGHELVTVWWMRSDHALLDERFLKGAARDLGGVAADKTREWFTGFEADALIETAKGALTPAPKPPLSYYFPNWNPEDFPLKR